MLKSLFILTAVVQLSAEGVDPDLRSGPRTEGRAAAASLEYDGSARQLDVSAPRSLDPGIRIDGRIDPAEWEGAALLRGFTQYDPLEGTPASERTLARVLVSSDAVYFAIRADDASGGVRATLTERDGFARSDDWVRVVLDTFHDQRRAFVFMVNPRGVQGDGLWVEGGGGRGGFGDPIDWSPDFLWESSGRVDGGGYSVEMRIPLKSLRFPETDVQDWGLQIQRTIRRTGYSQSWAPITRDRANGLSMAGALRGLRELDAGLFLEVNPTVVGSRAGAFDPGVAGLAHTATGDAGLNLTYGLTSNLTLDGTLNPDFSQIEADAGQIVVNERFAMFLPEKRPFFLEGADIFRMPRQLVYTRSIANPVGAAKISGKVGSFNVAYLGAVDDVGSDASRPVVNLVRLKRDVGRSSAIGAVYTDRTTPGERFNRVLGADARLVLGGRYTLEMLAAGSADAESGLATDFGSLLRASVRRAGRSLSLSGSFEDATDAFVAGSGFIRRTGVTQVDARTGWTFRGGRGALVESWGPSLEVEGVWTRDDFWSGRGPQENEVQVGLRGFFRGNVGAFVDYTRSSFDFDPEQYGTFRTGASIERLAPLSTDQSRYGGLHRISVRSWISTWERARLSFGGTWSETPLFARGLPLDLGRSWSGDAGVTLYPTGSMQAELGARHVSIFRARDGSRYSSATIPRLQLRYQLSRALFVRGIGEYASQERGELLEADTGAPIFRCVDGSCAALEGSRAHDFSLEALLAYEPSPGTVVFLGYTRRFEDTAAFGFREIRPVGDGLFAKLSYRFRM